MSDGGDGDAEVAGGEARQVVWVVGEDHATTEADRCRDDECVDGQFTARTCRGKQVTGDSSRARARGHDLGEAARQDRIDRGVSATTAVELHEHRGWHPHWEVLPVGASERGADESVAVHVLVWTCERGQRLAVKN